jgi:3-oxoacyl-[acyl-carrier-protein] synthase-3
MSARISLPQGAPGARILGLGSYRPRRRVTNDDLAQVMDTNDEWIQSRVGIAERRWASEDETLVEMAVAAGGKAIAASGLAPDEIDLVIVASASLRAPIPGIGPQVAHRLGVPRPGSFDLNAGCAGFCYALGVANDNIRSGSSRNALIVGVERLSDVTDQTDRSTAVIFADGAGAAVVGASDEPGIGPVAWGSDGDQYNAIEIAAGSSTMTMAGQAVYRWATTKLTQTLVEAMEKAGVGPADIDVFAPHQANLRIIESMSKRLGFPETTVIARDIVQSGNTSAASIPLALTALMESGEAKSGDLALVLGYGAGLTFAGQVLVLP